MTLTGKNIIGDAQQANGKFTFHAVNPADGSRLSPVFYDATTAEINEAITLADTAFQEYRKKDGHQRAAFLDLIADEIEELGNTLIIRATEETGLPANRISNERQRTLNQIRLFAELLREGSWVNARIDTPDSKSKVQVRDIRSMEKALGPVGVFGASNFPLAFSTAGGDTISALAAGCTVVFKAHPAHPGTCEFVGKAIYIASKKADMPTGVFSMLHGKETRVGTEIVRHPLIRAIGFTGSFIGGKALFDEANKRPVPIPVYAEMGSTNPVFILPRIIGKKNLKLAEELVASVTLGAGQFCTNPGLVFIGKSEKRDLFINNLINNINDKDPQIMLSEEIRNNYRAGIEKLSWLEGVNVLAKGTKKGDFTESVYLLSSSAENFFGKKELEGEVFGPSTLTISAENKEQLLEAARRVEGHLTATVLGTTDDLMEYEELIGILEQKVGRVLINDYPTGVEVCNAMVHGGPFPATTDSRTTSVGTMAISRFTRPVCFQNFPQFLLPDELKDENPLDIWRLVNGEMKR